MEKYIINGGRELNGEVKVQGSKNAVLPILSACLLHKGVTVIENCPDIDDVHVTLEILRHLGCKADYENGKAIVDATVVTSNVVPAELAGKLRSSILFMGALLGRLGEVTIAYPGECVIQYPYVLHGMKGRGTRL